MLFPTLFCAVAALSGMVNAQNYTAADITIDPNSVDLPTRQDWCTTQQQSCPLLCADQQAFPNTCDAGTLQFSCVCTTGNQPNLSDFSGTIPTYTCEKWQSNCIAANVMNASAQARCLSVQCGQRAVGSALSTTTSAPASTSTMATSASSGTQSSTTAPTAQTPTGAASAINIAQSYGTGLLLTGLLALFGVAL